MRELKFVLLLGIFLFSLSFVSAATCLNVTAKTTQDYITEIPSINSQLASCTVDVPNSIYKILGEGNILVNITLNSGATEQFYVTISSNKVVTGISSGVPLKYNFKVSFSEATMDKILTSNDSLNEALRGVKNKDIKVKANSFSGSIKWFFAKFFLPNPGAPAKNTPAGTNANQNSAVTGEVGKPNFCDETYLPGHRDYAQNKELWDGYSANSDKVCQSQYGKGIPSPCIHAVQLSIEGKPYYLCWYNE